MSFDDVEMVLVNSKINVIRHEWTSLLSKRAKSDNKCGRGSSRIKASTYFHLKSVVD